jgi:hypothetical protein
MIQKKGRKWVVYVLVTIVVLLRLIFTYKHRFYSPEPRVLLSKEMGKLNR